jgi:hypothetical protein
MRQPILLLPACLFSLFLILSACNKTAAPTAPNSTFATMPTSGSAAACTRPSFVTVSLDNVPMQVTAINYNRTGGNINLSAFNPLQKVDVYCFWFYEQSGFNYQFSDSINYSTRPDTLTAWSSTRATDWGGVSFDCCTAPLKDSLITGNYSGTFSLAKKPLIISGNFYLHF